MLLNAFDVDPGAAERTLELQAGELFELSIQADLLVVSARRRVYDPVPGTLVERLQKACGIKVAELPRALDLSSGPLAAWVSHPLQEILPSQRWPEGSRTRFGRIAVVENAGRDEETSNDEPWPVFHQLFTLLAILPLQGINCPVVATPLLGAGDQRVAPQRLFPSLLDLCRGGFRHVPDLERLIVFDRQRLALERLADLMDQELDRTVNVREVIMIDPSQQGLKRLCNVLELFDQRHPDVGADNDRQELLHMLMAGEATPLALGMHARRLIEHLVNHRLGWRRRSLYQGLQSLRQQDINPWMLSCLHQVRVFGNWMGHPSRPGQWREVEASDVVAMLTALQRVLEDYPW